MARMRVLDLAKPFAMVLPEVQYPYQRVEQMERLVFTVCSAFLYAVLAEVPLYTRGSSARPLEAADPIAWLRPALAMSHGSPLELGVLPVLVAGFVFQLAAGMRKLNVSLDLRSERALFQSAQKLLALAIAAALALLLAFVPGTFGTAADLSLTSRILLAAQLFGGAGMLVFLDEIISKGYGVGTGVLLFTSLRAAQAFVWAALSLQSVSLPGVDGTQTLGAVSSLFWSLKDRSLKYAVTASVFRGNGLPGILDIVIALVVFFGMIYVATIRVDLQIRSTKVRGQSQAYPVRLLYTGAQPVLFVVSVLATYLLASYAVSGLVGAASPVAQVLGAWDIAAAKPVAGIAYFLVPQCSGSLLFSAARAVAYFTLLSGLGAWFAGAWTRASGFAPTDVAKQFKENNIVLVGKRDVSVAKELGRIIPLAATLGGAAVGGIVAVSDLLGGAGWGSTVSIAALNTFNIFELLAQEGMVGPNASMPMI